MQRSSDARGVAWTALGPSLDRLDAELGLLRADADARAVASFRDAARDELVRLRGELERTLGGHASMVLLLPVVLWVDERAQRLADVDPAQWPLLQDELFGVDDGGAIFYAELRRFLTEPEPDPTVLSVYAHVLQAGFQGQLAEDPQRRQTLLTDLHERLAAGLPSASEPPRTAVAFEWSHRSPARYYVGLAVGLILLHGALVLLGSG